MDPEEDQQGQDQNQPSVNDQGVTKKIARKGLQALRGFGVAGEAAAEAAPAAGVGAAEGAVAGEAAAVVAEGVAGAGTATTAAATGTSAMGMWALAACLIVVFLLTFIIVLSNGQSTVNAGTPTTAEPLPPPPPTTNTDCSSVAIPGLTCTVDDGTNGTHHVEFEDQYVYTVNARYDSGTGERDIASFKLKLTIPNDTIEFVTTLPGDYDQDVNGNRTTYTWDVAKNISLFTQLRDEDSLVYELKQIRVTAKPKANNTIASVEFLIE